MVDVAELTRWILSICLLAGALSHIDLLSIIDALLCLLTPWALIRSSFTRFRFFFVVALIGLISSSLALLIVTALHIVSVTQRGKHLFSEECASNVRILQHLGLNFWMHTTNKVAFLSELLANMMIICSSVAVLITHRPVNVHRRKSSVVIPEPDDSPRIYSRLSSPFHFIPLRIRPFFVYLRSLILLALIHSCGSLVPSILSAVYFFVSLGLTCWWALGKNFARAYLQIIRLLQIYSACHLFAMHLYQLPSIEHYLFQSRITLASRLGFHSLYQHSCLNNPNPLKHHWIIYVHPLIIMTLYWVTIYEYHLTRKYHQRMKRVLLEQRQRPSTELENISPNAQSQSSRSGDDGRFHLHSIVDLFWSAPSNDQLNYRTNSLFIALISYTLSKAYILSILAMLFWSITYHSYLTFVYLILACFIWILSRTRYWCHFLSPFFSIYAYILLILNYADLLHLFPARYSYFMHEIETLHPDEHRQNTVSVRTYVECSIKFGYTLLLLLSLRQRTRELTDQQQRTDAPQSTLNPSARIKLLPPVHRTARSPSAHPPPASRFHLIRSCLHSKYLVIYDEVYYLFYMGYVHRWFYKIFVTGSSVLTIILIFALSYGSGSTPVAYRIVYMGFFLQYHLCYYFSRRLWKLFLYPFYVTLVIYSMCVLFAIYIYQFQQIQSMKTSQCFVHLSCELFLSSLGIRRAYQTRLGKELLTPAIFIVFIVMYIHFFHRQARKREISTPNYHEELPSIRILKIIHWLAVRFDRIQPILWRLIELFSYKIILLIVGFCLTRQTNINVTNFLLVGFYVISLLFPIFQGLALGLYALVSALHILMIMIVRLELFVTLGEVTDVCYSASAMNSNPPYLSNIHPALVFLPVHPLEWFGLWTSSKFDLTLGRLITPYLSVVLSVTALQWIRRHRRCQSVSLDDLFYCTHIHLFESIDLQSMNDSPWHTLKYLCNYATYRFGLELSLFAALCLIMFRMDAISLAHALVVLVCLLLPRHHVRRFWKLYRVFASISVIWLYLNSLGLPPVLCLKHIFDHWIEDWFPARIWSHLKVYFYISDYGEWRPLSEHLLPDLILLIVLAIQEKNFLLEQRQASVEQMGNNVDHQSQSYRPHLLHDFLTNATLSWANRLASLFYSYVYWLIIIYLYIVATYRQSLFYFLLLLACFYFLWEGQAFLQRPFQQQKSLWHLLLLSLFSIFIAQLFMQWVSCILIHYTTLAQRCMLMNFLGTSCSIRRFQQLYATDCLVHQLPQKISARTYVYKDWQMFCEKSSMNNSLTTRHAFYCQSDTNHLMFDAFGFLFLLFFIRLLNSYAFFYVRLELQVQTELSQIGASLLSQLNWLKLVEYRQRTTHELESIKARVTQIRQRRTIQKREADIEEPIYHYPAIHSGDYYMFDYAFDAVDNSNSFHSTVTHPTESGYSMSLIDVFDWRASDDERVSPLNNSQWDEDALVRTSIDEQLSNNEHLPNGLDLSSLMTFFELKQSSDKIRNALDTMNSRLMIYLGHQVRTLLIISQVIADAKLYLKYPSESAQLITTVVPEHINDYVINAFQNLPKRSSVPPSPSPRAHHAQTTTNLQEEIARANLNHGRSSENINIQPVEPSMSQHRAGLGVNRWNSRLWTWFQSSLKKASFHDGPERSFSTTDPRESTPVAPHSQTSDLTATNPIASSDVSHSKDRQPSINIDEHLEKLKASRMHIGPMTIVTTLILSKFDYLTYMALIVNFLASGAALIWLPLLASIYFWAMLTFPYPSRHFWHVITFSCMLILLIQNSSTFVPSLVSKAYIRYSLIGHLNLPANLLLLAVLSFHRIVLHQLGLWDDFQLPTGDSLLYQTELTPSNIKRFRDQILQGIYSMLKNEIEHDQHWQARNSNARQSMHLVDHFQSETDPAEKQEKDKLSFSLRHCWDQLKDLTQSIRNFYRFAIACPIVPKVDYYSSMFFCDFLVIVLIIAGHQRFSRSESVEDNIVYRYLQGSSSIEITPIVMLLSEFLLIIVDRMIYLKKHVQAKFLFLCLQFLVLHVWLVIIYPIWFQRAMSKNWAAVSIYIFKSIYFMLSALQIRNGYPMRILGNFLTSRFSVLRLLCYKVYCIIPFVYEMRVLMDWMFIPTSLSLTYYFMMEEIARNAWTQKCWRVTDARAPTKRAENRSRCERYCIGGWILFAIVFVIWFPLVFFSISTSLADPIFIDRCEIKVRLSIYKELYQLVTSDVRQPSTMEFLRDISPLIINSSFASGSREFTEADIACIRAPGNVGAQWSISSSGLHQLQEELKHFLNQTALLSAPQIYLDYSLVRKGQAIEQDAQPSSYSILLAGSQNTSLSQENAFGLLAMLSSPNQTEYTIVAVKLMPKFIHLLPDMVDIKSDTHRQSVRLTLRRHEKFLWWDVAEVMEDAWSSKCSFDAQSLNLIAVSERAGAQSKSFNLIAKLLIGSSAKLTLIGVYAGLVYVLWLTCFRQTLFSDIRSIMYQEWPFADRVEKLCEEVYLVRELGELQLEEELFARLLFLHRSPETLVRFTRPQARTTRKEHTNDQHLHQQ